MVTRLWLFGASSGAWRRTDAEGAALGDPGVCVAITGLGGGSVDVFRAGAPSPESLLPKGQLNPGQADGEEGNQADCLLACLPLTLAKAPHSGPLKSEVFRRPLVSGWSGRYGQMTFVFA